MPISRLVLLGLIVFGATASAQPSPGAPQLSPERRAADSLLAAKRFPEAVAAFERLTTTEPNRPGHWYQLGMSGYGAGRYDQAAQAFLKAHSIARNPSAVYNASAMYAKLGRADDAFRWLDSSLSLQPFPPQQLEQDDDYAGLRSDPRFAKALDRSRRAITPCMYDPNYRRLDFWIGEWDVKTIAGGQAGQSVVESIAGGCALLENWIPGGGRPGGKSINTWHPQQRQLQQYWVGGGGGVTEYRKGTWTDTSVVYTAEITGASGEPTVLRLTFAAQKDGRVRQLAEQSINGGAWTTQYDFYYVRRK